jgi:endonuclease YncB( thermonuclease family)
VWLDVNICVQKFTDMKLYTFPFYFLFFSICAFAQEYNGKVVGISDGDTFTLLTADKKQIKVRLAEIDTPERAQPFGDRSQQTLSALIFSKDVVVVEEDTDRYGRLVGHVYVDGTHVNRQMVKDGMAWVYRQYLKDKTLLQDEQEAREARRGLWSLPSIDHVPPWEWRKGNRTATTKKEPIESNPEFKCGTKRYCKEMSSCEEARYYLENCGLSRLDGDGDGIPCETLCK